MWTIAWTFSWRFKNFERMFLPLFLTFNPVNLSNEIGVRTAKTIRPNAYECSETYEIVFDASRSWNDRCWSKNGILEESNWRKTNGVLYGYLSDRDVGWKRRHESWSCVTYSSTNNGRLLWSFENCSNSIRIRSRCLTVTDNKKKRVSTRLKWKWAISAKRTDWKVQIKKNVFSLAKPWFFPANLKVALVRPPWSKWIEMPRQYRV